MNGETGEKGVVHARYLRSQEISQVLRARDDAVEPPGGLCAGADIAQGSVGEDLDDQFGGEVQESWRHGLRAGRRGGGFELRNEEHSVYRKGRRVLLYTREEEPAKTSVTQRLRQKDYNRRQSERVNHNGTKREMQT